MQNNNFRNLRNNYSVCKNAKYMAIVPFVIVLAAIIVIVAIGANTGSYTDAVGIGIDFAGVVHAALLNDVQRLELVDVAEQDVACEAGGLDHDGDGGFLHGDRLP